MQKPGALRLGCSAASGGCMGLVLQRKRAHATLSLSTTIADRFLASIWLATGFMRWMNGAKGARDALYASPHLGMGAGRYLLSDLCSQRRGGLLDDLPFSAKSVDRPNEMRIELEVAMYADDAKRGPARALHVQHVLAAHGSAQRRDV